MRHWLSRFGVRKLCWGLFQIGEWLQEVFGFVRKVDHHFLLNSSARHYHSKALECDHQDSCFSQNCNAVVPDAVVVPFTL
jgi:hypothetical protein